MTIHNIEVVEGTLQHVRYLRKDLRPGDRNEAIAAGLDPSKACVYAFKNACWRRTGLIDGEPAAMWGVRGVPLGLVGQPYLITSTKVSLISPLKFARIYIKEVEMMKNMFPVLENYVDASYERACQMLDLAGFSLEPVIINNHKFYRFSMAS